MGGEKIQFLCSALKLKSVLGKFYGKVRKSILSVKVVFEILEIFLDSLDIKINQQYFYTKYFYCGFKYRINIGHGIFVPFNSVQSIILILH